MADNTIINAGTGGDTIRDKDRTGVKTQIVALDLNPAGAESLMAGSVPVTGTFWQATQPVSGTVTANAGTGPFPVSDNAGSLTVDSPVGTPTFVRLSDGTAAIATLPVSLASAPTTPVTGTFWQATQPVSGTVTADTELPAAAASADALANPTTSQVGADLLVFNGSTWDRARGNTTIGQQVGLTAAPLIVSTTAAIGIALTATLPAPAAGLFHYITRINILKYAGVAVVGAAAPVVVTSTNLAGSLAWSTPTAQAVGTQYETDVQPAAPIKSSVAATATTIVCPATTSIIWRVNVYYYTAP